MPDMLIRISKVLNAAGILWGLGGSQLLHHHGLIANPNDIDLMVSENDIQKAEALLAGLGHKLNWEMTAPYETRRFLEYLIAGQEVDVMCSFAIRHPEGLYRHPFDTASIQGFACMGGVSVPLMHLEDWYVLYQLIPGREAKVALIEEHLAPGILKPPPLLRILEGNLPAAVRERILRILKNSPL